MNVTTISNEKYMSYEYYNIQPMQLIELNLFTIFNNKRHLINALDGSINHPSIRNYSNLSFN